MLAELKAYWLVLRKFRDYKPQHPTLRIFRKWLSQFDEADRRWLIQFVNAVIYLDERAVRNGLVLRNGALLKRLERDGVDARHVIYVQYSDPGSSSGTMLNLLRDAGNLERKGCHFVDGRNQIAVRNKMDELGGGAIIYVDDFVGTGAQFCRERDALSKSFVGVFPEFLLVPAICEEAFEKLARRGVKWEANLIHSKSQRPLLEECPLFPDDVRNRLRQVALDFHPRHGLGFQGIASMVVLYRNSPNNLPMVLRGDFGQHPRVGLLPRFQDFPTDGSAPPA